MSTPERPGVDALALPPELSGVAGHVPAPTNALELPTRHVPTPGVSPAVVKHPGAPTLPEGDPTSVALLIQRLANELFLAPPAAAPVSGGPTSAAATPALPGGVPTAPVANAPTVPAATPSLPDGVPATPASSAPTTAPPTTAAPTVLPGVPTAPTALPNVSTVPASGAPATTSSGGAPAAPDVPTTASPFHGRPNFDALFGPEAALSFPLFEAPATATAPKAPAAATPFSAPTQLEPTSHGYQQLGPGLFDPHALRREFPILEQRVHGKPLVWLDNAATTQKPRSVIDRLSRFYETENSNIHRAAHTLAARATDAYESARETVRRFINAPSTKEIIFVRGTTEGINLVAQSWGRRNIQAGDEIVITWLEHHANIVPWQQLAAEKGAKLKVAPVDDRGQVILDEYEKLLGPRTRLVSLTQVSNALGTITPAQQMVELAHRHGAKVLVDGAQSVSHLRTDVQALGADFFVFSGHKVFGPTGIGVVFGRAELLDAMPPWQGGGNMIQDVTFEKTTFHPAPARFEAGTGNIADAVGLGAALDWLSRVGVENVSRYEHELLEYATARLLEVPGLTLYGTAAEKAGVLSFVLSGHKTEQVGGLLDREGIAVRSGHHCAQPILRRLGVEATVRASLAPYNTTEDIDALVVALCRLQEGA